MKMREVQLIHRRIGRICWGAIRGGFNWRFVNRFAVFPVRDSPLTTTRIAKDSLDKMNEKNKKRKDEGDRDVEIVTTAKKNDKIQECIFILSDGTAKKIDVKTGIQDNTYIQITSGLKVGDEIITAPYSAVSKLLKDGDKVKKVDKKDLFTKE